MDFEFESEFEFEFKILHVSPKDFTQVALRMQLALFDSIAGLPDGNTVLQEGTEFAHALLC